jgi:Uma2 family endonuclease
MITSLTRRTDVASALKRPNELSESEYLSDENTRFQRHEFLDGHVYAMAGATENHSGIKLNLVGWLSSRLPLGCRLFDGDMKLRVQTARATAFYYPDVFISCGPRSGAQLFRTDATLIVEILSPTTERIDRTEKRENYQSVASLNEYLLVDGRRRTIEVHRRSTGWTPEVFAEVDHFHLASVSTDLPAAVVFHDLVD